MTWPPADPAPTGPLAGIRILDLSRILAGPFSTQVMADLGADVIKVERPGTGDESRRWGPPFAASGDACYFFVANRGRRSAALDLRDDADREVVLRLAADADVLVENFLPGTMERLGLDDATLDERNPRLVHAVISGYGHQSSRADWPALDFVIQAHAGIISVTGEDQEHAVKVGVPIADLSAGLFATIGVLAALREAQVTGHGRRVEVSLAEACTAMLANQAIGYLLTGAVPGPRGNNHPNVAPYQVLRAADADLAVAASSEAQFAKLCALIGADHLPADPRFATNADRVTNRADLEVLLSARLADRPAGEWARACNEAGVPASVINTVDLLIDDPDTQAGMVARLPDGTGQLRTPIRLDGRPLPLASPPPRLGEHTDAIRNAVTSKDPQDPQDPQAGGGAG